MGRPKITIKKPTIAEVAQVIENLREADYRELIATFGPEEAFSEVYLGLEMPGAETRLALVDGVPTVLWGHCPFIDDEVGVVWGMSTDGIYDMKEEFIENTQIWIDWMQAPYGMITNIIDARNTLHINWIKRYGFKISRELPGFGEQGEDFLEFLRYK